MSLQINTRCRYRSTPDVATNDQAPNSRDPPPPPVQAHVNTFMTIRGGRLRNRNSKILIYSYLVFK